MNPYIKPRGITREAVEDLSYRLKTIFIDSRFQSRNIQNIIRLSIFIETAMLWLR
jgi:hypothetical protein